MKSIQLGQYGSLDVYLINNKSVPSRSAVHESIIAVRRHRIHGTPTYAATVVPEENLTDAELKRWLRCQCSAIPALKNAIGYTLFVFKRTYNPTDVTLYIRQPEGLRQLGTEIQLKGLKTSRQRLRHAQRHVAEISLLLMLLTERRPMMTAELIDL